MTGPVEATATIAPAPLPAPTGVVPQFARLPMAQKLALMIGAAAAAAIVVGAWLYAREPDWKVLFGSMSDRDGGATIVSSRLT